MYTIKLLWSVNATLWRTMPSCVYVHSRMVYSCNLTNREDLHLNAFECRAVSSRLVTIACGMTRTVAQRLAARHKGVETGSTVEAAEAVACCGRPIKSRKRKGGSRLRKTCSRIPHCFPEWSRFCERRTGYASSSGASRFSKDFDGSSQTECGGASRIVPKPTTSTLSPGPAMLPRILLAIWWTASNDSAFLLALDCVST